jgi:hypothetical protein
MSAYPKPATPLPWEFDIPPTTADYCFAHHTANAFPHLVAALASAPVLTPQMFAALAIARGEVAP